MSSLCTAALEDANRLVILKRENNLQNSSDISYNDILLLVALWCDLKRGWIILSPLKTVVNINKGNQISCSVKRQVRKKCNEIWTRHRHGFG